ncbi:SRSO17 transposase [Bradyrhizobium japonicum]
MAARTAPARTAAQHQSLLHFVGNATWSDENVLAKVRQMVLPAIEKAGPIDAWIIDDTSFPKQGKHLLRSARQAHQLPSGRVSVDRQPCRQPSGDVSAVPPGTLGEGSRTP